MQSHEYRAVPAPRRGVKARGAKGEEARFAAAVEGEMNRMAREGWEFVRSDTLPCEEKQGWLGGRTTVFRTLLVFRRPLAGAAAQPALAMPPHPAPIHAALIHAAPSVASPPLAAPPYVGPALAAPHHPPPSLVPSAESVAVPPVVAPPVSRAPIQAPATLPPLAARRPGPAEEPLADAPDLHAPAAVRSDPRAGSLRPPADAPKDPLLALWDRTEALTDRTEPRRAAE